MLDMFIGPNSYIFLKVLWWVLVGVLFVGFATMDGHDMGVGSLLPFAGKTDEERRAIINTIGPHWDGNQVWFITAGGALFAAWQFVYAAAFSGLYLALLAVLWCLFFRPTGFDYRSKINDPSWRKMWDWALFAGSFGPALLFGVAFGNLLIGLPFHYDTDTLRPLFDKGPFFLFVTLLHPFALICGLVSAGMLIFHGSVFLALRTEGDIQARTLKIMPYALGVALGAFTLAGIWTFFREGYALQNASAALYAAAPDPTIQQVARGVPLLHNYYSMPFLFLFPILGYAGLIGAFLLVKAEKMFIAFWSSAVGMLGIICTAGIALFPFVMPSYSEPNHSLTLWNVTASNYTLVVMTIVTVIAVPILITYTGWCYYLMRGKVTTDFIRKNDHSAY